MTLVTLLQLAQLVVFPLLGAVAGLVWARRRTRPAAYLAAAFGALAAVFIVARLSLPGWEHLWQTIVLAALLSFPWLLAAFAWSFEGALPRWLRYSSLLVAVLVLWELIGAPIETDGDQEQGARALFLVATLAIWTLLTIGAAGQLWRAGGRQRLVRARMRLMAMGAFALTLALFLSAFPTDELAGVEEGVALLSLVSAALFVAGFAPPPPLRLWWRRRSSRQWQQMQADLIAAATPTEVARAVAPMAADLLGGEVTIVGPECRVLASMGPSPEDAAEVARKVCSQEPLAEHAQLIPIHGSWLVVQPTAYTPLFGQQEHQMIDALALQLRFALERAELFDAHQRALTSVEQTRQELEALLVGLSHDLRSPAVAIAGYMGLLREVDDPDDREEMFQALEASASYLNSLVEAMLELSRVGRSQLKVEAVDLEHTVRKVFERIRVNHPGITVEIRPGLPAVLMNPSRVEQLFDNLLINAAKHSGRQDVTVTVGSQPGEDGGVRLVVADDGKGIDPADQASVFELFQRGSTATAGSGVGLGMVRRIVEFYGGSIRVVTSDQGARFNIDLPEPAVVSSSVGAAPADGQRS